MTNNPGMLTTKRLGELAKSREIETVAAVFTDLYGRFMGKRFDVDFFLDTVARDGTHGCDYLLTVDMEMEPVPGYEFANWQRGYGDVHLVPILDTLRCADWLDRTALVICDVYSQSGHSRVAEAPRSVLRRQIDRLESQGLTADGASELEFFMFEDSYRDAADQHYHDLSPTGWYLEDYHMLQGARMEHFNSAVRAHLKQSGIPVESTKGEWGLGQHELNIRYTDVPTMADRHAILKQCLKEVADQMAMSVTFMAKYSADRAGSSCHIHLSLKRGDANAFCGTRSLGSIRCSDEFRWFLGGWIVHVPDVMAFYAPTVNAYKRYQSGSWAPTRLAWSFDNRTAGFRIVGHGDDLRIECRIPGADCNPYLAYAAAVASGMDGITNRIEPPPMFEGNAYEAEDVAEVPRTLKDAITLFKSSEFAKAAFGENVVAHYVHFLRAEQEAYDNAVTDWERQRYFERI